MAVEFHLHMTDMTGIYYKIQTSFMVTSSKVTPFSKTASFRSSAIPIKKGHLEVSIVFSNPWGQRGYPSSQPWLSMIPRGENSSWRLVFQAGASHLTRPGGFVTHFWLGIVVVWWTKSSLLLYHSYITFLFRSVCGLVWSEMAFSCLLPCFHWSIH